MLKIKVGSVIIPYGADSRLDENSELSQEVINHLKTRYPDDIEGELEKEAHVPELTPAQKAAATRKANEDKLAAAKSAEGEPKVISKEELQAMVDKKKAGTATPEEVEIIAQARLAGKI